MKRGIILLPLILAILAINVLALDVTYKPIQDQVLPGHQAQYVLKITNNEAGATDVRVKSIDLNWILENDEVKFYLQPGESVEFNAIYAPIDKNIKPGKYGMNYRVESDSKTLINDFLPVAVLRYDEVLDIGFIGEPIVDPQRASLLKLQVANLKPIELRDVTVKIESVPINSEKKLDLIKNEKDAVDFQVEPNSNAKEGDYTARITITYEGKTLVDKELLVKVGIYNDLQEVVEPEKGILILGEKIKLVNNGNSVLEQSYARKLSWVQSFFTSFEPEPTSVEKSGDGFMYAKWDYKLGPGESLNLSYRTNYLAPIIYALLFVIIVGGIYILTKKDLAVNKRILTLHTTEGNIAIMKVLISVTNKSGLALNDIVVLDKVPGSIKSPVEFGMIKPSSVKNVGEYSALIWNIPHLKKDEERVISYKIEGRVNILNTIVLPSALAKFGLGSKKKVFSSKSVSLSKKH